jgi:hypothetical protein
LHDARGSHLRLREPSVAASGITPETRNPAHRPKFAGSLKGFSDANLILSPCFERAARRGADMSAAKILDRLERAKQTGPGRWIACCPAHEDRSPSLSIRELDDGRILLHDFAGCSTSDVLGALGLALSDLFEEPLGHSFAPTHSRISARDALEAVDHEILVTVLILDDVLTERKACPQQVERLTQAAARISKARDMAAPMQQGARA